MVNTLEKIRRAIQLEYHRQHKKDKSYIRAAQVVAENWPGYTDEVRCEGLKLAREAKQERNSNQAKKRSLTIVISATVVLATIIVGTVIYANRKHAVEKDTDDSNTIASIGERNNHIESNSANSSNTHERQKLKLVNPQTAEKELKRLLDQFDGRYDLSDEDKIYFLHLDGLVGADDKIAELSEFGPASNVHSISLALSDLTDKGLKQLSNWKKLRFVYLEESQITPNGLYHFLEERNFSLEELKLCGSSISSPVTFERVKAFVSSLSDYAKEDLPPAFQDPVKDWNVKEDW